MRVNRTAQIANRKTGVSRAYGRENTMNHGARRVSRPAAMPDAAAQESRRAKQWANRYSAGGGNGWTVRS